MNETNEQYLDISPLISGEKKELSFDRTFFRPLEENGVSLSSYRFFGTAKDLSGFLRLSGTVRYELHALCARCLTPVTQTRDGSVDLPVLKEDEESEEEAITAEGDRIDLVAAAEDLILIDMPIRLLCREDCKGLCPVCGKNRNEGDCHCKPQETDPRLAGLADFFKED